MSSLGDVVPDQPPQRRRCPVGSVEHVAPGHDAYTAQENWKAAFNAGRLGAPVGTLNGKIVDKAKVLRLVRQKPRTQIHRSNLPLPPKTRFEMLKHPLDRKMA